MGHHIRILLVDDHAGLRQSIRGLFECRQDFEVCGEAEDGMEAITKSAELQPDVVVMNVSMPIMNGFDAARQLKVISPHSGVVILSSDKDEALLREAKNVGAICYVLKAEASRELIDAVVAAADGRSAVL